MNDINICTISGRVGTEPKDIHGKGFSFRFANGIRAKDGNEWTTKSSWFTVICWANSDKHYAYLKSVVKKGAAFVLTGTVYIEEFVSSEGKAGKDVCFKASQVLPLYTVPTEEGVRDARKDMDRMFEWGQ